MIDFIWGIILDWKIKKKSLVWNFKMEFLYDKMLFKVKVELKVIFLFLGIVVCVFGFSRGRSRGVWMWGLVELYR